MNSFFNTDFVPFAQPLLGGVLIGLASWLLLASLGRVAGVSGIAAAALVPSSEPRGWRWAFLVGLVVGGALFANSLVLPVVQTRPLWLLGVAGLLVGFGTVLGSGCTSGHGVCGLGRGSARSGVAVLTFMGVAMLTTGVMRVWGD